MKYMLMMTGTKADFDWYAKWPKQDLQAHFAFMHAFNKELKDSGTFVATEGLAFPDQAKMVHAGNDGEPITDGVFPESKEFLAGYNGFVTIPTEAGYSKMNSRLQTVPDKRYDSIWSDPTEKGPGAAGS